MKRSIKSMISTQGLPLFRHCLMARVLRRLKFRLSNDLSDVTRAASGLWIRAINGVDSDCFESIEELHGLITDYFNQPELIRYMGSGKRLTVRPI